MVARAAALRTNINVDEYLVCYALPLLRTNALILRLPFELSSL